jgi:serine phosphatase RsbU (regulator of sigma subunit)
LSVSFLRRVTMPTRPATDPKMRGIGDVDPASRRCADNRDGVMDRKDLTANQPGKKNSLLGYIWLRLLLATGLLLGLLLLVQSVATYYQVARVLVNAELRKEAEQYVLSIEREARRLGIKDPAELSPLLDDMRQDAPSKVAWVRVTDLTGHTLVLSGNPAGAPLPPERLRPPFEYLTPVSEVRRTEAGTEFVTALPLRIAGRPPMPVGGRGPFRGPDRVSGQHPPPWAVEIALFLNSASGTFGRLQTNLIVSSSAALGLVASMIFLWVRLPQYVQGKQLERQTELARQVQMDLLPAADVVFKGVDFAAACLPALQVGGDFYDAFAAHHARVAIVLGDVSGKGLPASMVVGLLLGAVRASGWMGGAMEHEAASRRLSELLRTRTSLERFASLFWCYYEPESQVLRYVNAGHLPPILVKRDGAGELQIQRLTEGGPVLGLLQSADYRQGQAVVCAGDLLVLYSDGVVEATNASGEQFDDDRLLAVIHENSGKSPARIREEILKRVQSFLGKERAQDDLTLVVARIRSDQNA